MQSRIGIKKGFLAILLLFALLLVSCASLESREEVASSFPADGKYLCEAVLSGGSGKASVESPCSFTIENGKALAKLIWSSSNYDYMRSGDGLSEKIINESAPGENSSFSIPVPFFDREFSVIADTTAMSVAHEIEYTLIIRSPGAEPSAKEEIAQNDNEIVKPELTGLTLIDSLPLLYTKGFEVEHYEDNAKNRYSFITIADGNMSGETSQYFLMASGGKGDISLLEENKKKNPGLTVIYDTKKTCIVSGQAMDPVAKLGAIENIAFSGRKKDDWAIPEAKDAMEKGGILYAGKYSSPDFELLLSGGCGLMIENTMIYHNPKIKEKLESIGIPVLVERSGYEDDPLGRLEWVKLYGAIFDREEEAKKLFDEQVERIEKVKGLPETDKTVAVFSVDSNGRVSVRRPGDYISRMIELSGGKYLPKGPLGDFSSSTVKLSMEDFFLKCESADILIYNSTISGEIEKKSDLVSKSKILKDMKAFKEGDIYCLSDDYYEMSMSTADFISDMRKVLLGEKEGLIFLKEVSD